MNSRIRLLPTHNEGVTSIFLSQLTEKHDVENAVFLIDFSSWLKATFHRHGLRFRYEKHGNRNGVEYFSQEIKQRIYQFMNYFSNAEPTTAETWLQRYAYCWNQLL